MIRSFRHKGLKRYFCDDDRSAIDHRKAGRIRRLLDRLDASTRPDDMGLPGFGFHELKGYRQGTYAVDVSGNLRITFRFESGDAFDVNLEDYH
jgi:proteic killer suppression protein